MKTQSLFFLTLLAGTFNSYSANLLTNGTFDADTTLFNTPAGWTLVSGDVHINPANAAPGLPTQSLDLGTGASSELTAPVTLETGKSYLVELDNYDWSGVSDLTPTHHVSIDGNVFDVLALSFRTLQPQSFSFVSNTTGVVDFSISTTTPFFDYNNFVDSLSVSEVPPVPEPSVSLLLSCTLACILKRRRPVG